MSKQRMLYQIGRRVSDCPIPYNSILITCFENDLFECADANDTRQ